MEGGNQGNQRPKVWIGLFGSVLSPLRSRATTLSYLLMHNIFTTLATLGSIVLYT